MAEEEEVDESLVAWLGTPRRLCLRDGEGERLFTFQVRESATTGRLALVWGTGEGTGMRQVGCVELAHVAYVKQSHRQPWSFVVTLQPDNARVGRIEAMAVLYKGPRDGSL